MNVSKLVASAGFLALLSTSTPATAATCSLMLKMVSDDYPYDRICYADKALVYGTIAGSNQTQAQYDRYYPGLPNCRSSYYRPVAYCKNSSGAYQYIYGSWVN